MKHKKGNDINGWLIIDKPEGMGSTEVVNFTRRFFNARKNGHTGTLDPFATGVLPIAFGEATKLIDFLQDPPRRKNRNARTRSGNFCVGIAENI